MTDLTKLTQADEAAMGTVVPEADPIARLADALVEDILATPDEEILAEMREDGLDPERVARHMRGLVEQAIAKHFAEADQEGWRPIETAPRGRILLYFPPTMSGRMELESDIRVDNYPVMYPRKPTRWQPLPAPPKDEPR